MLEHRKPVTSGVNVYQADYDNVRLTIGAVPEPIFGVALLAALPGVSLRRKRHQLV
jgi:hypothetical protein